MKLYPKSPLSLLCLIFTVITLFSCSKDSDLLADYVALDPEIGTIAKFVANDSYQISISTNPEDDTFEITINSGSGSTDNSGSDSTENGTSGGTAVNDTYQTSSDGSIILDVLSNDTFNNKEDVLIIENSQPENGNVVINNDNTLTYTPSSFETSENTFTYTAEFFTENGTVDTETATVTVEINPPSSLREGQINFSEYGAVGDGTTDDTAAIQAALDSEADLLGTPGAIYKITGTLNIDQSGDQIIDGNGATIIAGAEFDRFFAIDKASGITYLNNFQLDADLIAEGGVYATSSYSLTNIHVFDMYSNDRSVIGFYMSMRDLTNWSLAYMDNCSAVNMRAFNDGIIGNVVGATRGAQIEATVNTGIPFLIENSLFERAVAEDGDPFFWRVQGFDNTGTEVKLTLNRCTFKYGTRRVMKIQGGEIYIYNCTFESIPLTDPDIDLVEETAGMIAISSSTSGYNEHYLGHNYVFDGCVFNGSNFDNRIIQTIYATNISITNSQWNNGTQFRMWKGAGGVCIQNNTLSPGSKIYDVTFEKWLGPMVVENNINAPADFDQYSDRNPPAIGAFVCPK